MEQGELEQESSFVGREFTFWHYGMEYVLDTLFYS